MVVNGKSSISVTRKMSWVVLVLGLISVILWLLVDSAGKASFGKQLASNESITSCSGNGMLVCPLGQCCTPAGSCGDCALKSASLEASEVGEYFARKTQFEYYILVLSFLGLGEWTIFSVLNMMTFRNVYRNPDSTTSKPAVIICAISYLLCRLIFLPFYVAGSYLSVPGYEAEQILIFKIGTIALAVWWNMIMIMPCLTIWYFLLIGMLESAME